MRIKNLGLLSSGPCGSVANTEVQGVYGGTIEVESKVGDGKEFSLQLLHDTKVPMT